MRAKNLSGQRFGRLVAIEPTAERRWNNVVWRCRCDCGAEHMTVATKLLVGAVQSCGCLLREVAADRQLKHGLFGSPTYKTWSAMIQRCENPRSPSYGDYGARGIRVCPAWHSFDAFLADMGVRPDDRTIDRIDVNGHYELANCRWATRSEQRRNRRRP